MNNRILIVDDDDDFRSLLSDLYTQAEYHVKSVGNPLDALRVLAEEQFSLCVTDQSMPDLKGIDFIEKCRDFRPNLPIIMVSAYLSEDVTARLREQRVEVFHKPLNIMSLLRKTSELIKHAYDESEPVNTGSSGSAFSDPGESHPSKASTQGKSKLRSFPFKSDASKRLRKEIESIGIEMPNMVLVGDEGTHFDAICEDICSVVDTDAHHFMRFVNKKINVFDLSKAIAPISPSKTLVFALTEAQQMGVAHKQALMKLHKRSGPFADIPHQVKFIFCLNEDLDTQFARGAIDQDFYLIMGQKEIYIPRLDLCREDVADMARDLANELCQQRAVTETFGGFNSDATELLLQAEWEHNYASLKAVIAKALKLAKGSTITRDHLEKAIAEPDSLADAELSDEVAFNPTLQRSAATDGTVPRQSPVRDQAASAESNRSKASVQGVRRQRTQEQPSGPIIQSFTMLDDESALAKSILRSLLPQQ